MLKVCLAAAVLMTASTLFGADFTCPKEVHTDQKLRAPVPGWRTFLNKENERHDLHKIFLYDGRPEEMANLKPDNGDDPQGHGWEWTLYPTDGRRIWEVCVYDDTSIRLSKELPASVRKCRVIESTGPVREIETLRCE
jgi:hypothetical protein